MAMVAIAWILMRHIPVSHDVIWQMWVARQLIGGAQLYVEILELNPPLWFWLAVPVEWVAQIIALTPGEAIVGAVFVYATVSLLLVARICSDLDRWHRFQLLASVGFATICLPIPFFAQREHLTLIGAVPYVILAARRADRLSTPFVNAVLVGLVAAIGLALKHYFVLIPILLEVWLRLRLRRMWRPVRPETTTLAICGIVYAASVLLYAHPYFDNIVPMLTLAYDGYNASYLRQLVRFFVGIWLIGFPLLFWTGRSNLASVAFWTSAGFVAIYFIQQRGFDYHSLPATGLLFIGLAATLQIGTPSLGHALRSISVASALGLMLVVVAISGPYENSKRTIAEHFLNGVQPGEAVLMISANPSTIWPMIEEAGLVWPSRHMTFWMLAAIAQQQQQQGSLSPRMQLLADEIRMQTSEDMRCYEPAIILVDDLRRSNANGYDALRFFRQYEPFEEAFQSYKPIGKRKNLTAFVRQTKSKSPTPTSCRTVHAARQ
ncbi:hypothetical protein [Mesorhizobium sp. KR9-304]|uniref:hypothetical protein n=1 Tax=Mesorhizobium sp. KR9-304 TaxID=3156614 RepID=UPI0032B3218E